METRTDRPLRRPSSNATVKFVSVLSRVGGRSLPNGIRLFKPEIFGFISIVGISSNLDDAKRSGRYQTITIGRVTRSTVSTQLLCVHAFCCFPQSSIPPLTDARV